MYKQFNSIDNGAYALKLQGKISTIIVSASLFLCFGLALKQYFDNPLNKTLLILAGLMFIFALVILRRMGRKFELYPSQKLIKYSSGFGSGIKEISLDQVVGFTTQNTKQTGTGFKLGNALKLEYNHNGKIKEMALGQNISEKTIRIITEEFTQIMQ